MSQKNCGLILFAHGSRDPAWARPLQGICERIRHQNKILHVMPAFLEFLEPSLPEAIDLLMSEGIRNVTMVPCFLSPAGHVRREVPALLEKARLRYPDLILREAAPIGESDLVAQAIAEYAVHCSNVEPFHQNLPQSDQRTGNHPG